MTKRFLAGAAAALLLLAGCAPAATHTASPTGG